MKELPRRWPWQTWLEVKARGDRGTMLLCKAFLKGSYSPHCLHPQSLDFIFPIANGQKTVNK